MIYILLGIIAILLIGHGLGKGRETAGTLFAIIVYPIILFIGLMAWLLPAMIFLWLMGLVF